MYFYLPEIYGNDWNVVLLLNRTQYTRPKNCHTMSERTRGDILSSSIDWVMYGSPAYLCLINLHINVAMTYLVCNYVLADIQLINWYIYIYRHSQPTQTKPRSSRTSCPPRSRQSASAFILWRGPVQARPHFWCPNLRLKSMDAHLYKHLMMICVKNYRVEFYPVSSTQLLISI